MMLEFALSISEHDRSFLAAFLEGEATLSIAQLNGGQSYSCRVATRQRDDEQDLLEWCLALTGLGSLYRVPARATSRPQVEWNIESQDDCVELLRIIQVCGFHGRRSAELALWSDAVRTWTQSCGEGRRTRMRALRTELAAARRFRGGAASAVAFSSRREQLGYISGLVSAEGSFGLASGHPTFSIHLRHDDRPLLELLAATTGLGRVRDHRPYPPLAPNPSASWTISTHAEASRLLDLLTEVRLPGRKRREMETWAIAVDEFCSSRRLGVRPRRDLVALAGHQLRRVREYRPPTRVELLGLPDRDLRSEAIAALRAWADDADGPLACGGYSRWRRDHVTAPGRNTVARTFGSWYAAMEAAGLGDRTVRKTVTRGGGEARRRAAREQQRARVLAAVRRFEVEHGRLPRAMEFFRWRFEGAPESPTQATVYNLFPGGWAAVLDACRAGYGLG